MDINRKMVDRERMFMFFIVSFGTEILLISLHNVLTGLVNSRLCRPT